MPYDLLLRGGTVLDPSRGLHATRDVAIADGKIASVSESIPPGDAARIIDVSGKLVTPGLVDLHAHLFWGVGNGVDPERDCFLRGTTTAADAGTAGWRTFGAFRRYVAERSRLRIFAWLNLSSVGQVDNRVGEFTSLIHADVAGAVRTVERNRDMILGLKLRISNYVLGMDAAPYLKLLREAADAAGTRAMIHIGDTRITMPEILKFLRPGDVVSHCFTGGRNGILDAQGRVLEAVVEAQQAGILFDCCAGGNHFSFQVAASAFEQGFLPNVISTDMSANSVGNPNFHLPLIMTWNLALGMPLEKVVRAATVTPAAVIDRQPLPGTLAVGAPGDVTVLDLQQGEVTLRDSRGTELKAAQGLQPVLAIREGFPSSDLT